MNLLVLGLLQKILSGSGNTVIDVIIDAILSETSENPVQNKVVTKALKNKADISHKHTAVEVGADSIGSAETALNDAKKYTDGKIADIINGAPSTLDTLSEIATAMDENKSVVDALDKAIGTKANKDDIPTKISELENDSNFLTEHQDLSSYAKTEDIPTELPANGGNADTVNNHTVNIDVPSDAVFTDTVYTLPIATTEILGGVMPDGTTINVDENGVISLVGSGGSSGGMKLIGSYAVPYSGTSTSGSVWSDEIELPIDLYENNRTLLIVTKINNESLSDYSSYQNYSMIKIEIPYDIHDTGKYQIISSIYFRLSGINDTTRLTLYYRPETNKFSIALFFSSSYLDKISLDIYDMGVIE